MAHLKPHAPPPHPDPASSHFIPARQAELVELLCGSTGLQESERQALGHLAQLLSATLHHHYYRELTALKADYAPFDPDADTVPLFRPTIHDRSERMEALFRRFDWLLERANFVRLSKEDLAQAFSGSTHWGLHLEVDFEVFDRLEIYVRGETTCYHKRRRLANLFRREQIEAPAYQRLVIILKLRENRRISARVDTADVHLKLFKDIPRSDLEMLLPGTRVRMSLVDRTRIMLPTLSGAALTCWKLVSGALVVAATGVYNVVALCGLVGGSIGYGLRSFHGYLQTKQRYQLNLTESLYYQNLDNNAGVLMRLVDEAEEQENREALLAYFFLWQAGSAGLTPKELDERIEAFLIQSLGRPVDFEVQDAVKKLLWFHLVENLPAGKLRALPIDAALEKLDDSWDQLFTHRRAA